MQTACGCEVLFLRKGLQFSRSRDDCFLKGFVMVWEQMADAELRILPGSAECSSLSHESVRQHVHAAGTLRTVPHRDFLPGDRALSASGQCAGEQGRRRAVSSAAEEEESGRSVKMEIIGKPAGHAGTALSVLPRESGS